MNSRRWLFWFSLLFAVSIFPQDKSIENESGFFDGILDLIDKANEGTLNSSLDPKPFRLRIVGLLGRSRTIVVEASIRKEECVLHHMEFFQGQPDKKTSDTLRTISVQTFPLGHPFYSNLNVLARGLDLTKISLDPLGDVLVIPSPEYFIELRFGEQALKIRRGQLFPPYFNSAAKVAELDLPKKIQIDEQELMLQFTCFYILNQATNGNLQFFDDSWRTLLDENGVPKQYNPNNP